MHRLSKFARAVLLAPTAALAGGTQMLEPVAIVAQRDAVLGVADSASEGTVTQQQMATRPWLRPAEVLETVPGLIITQHSGDGKANQYFLRGFNLDHGTDFATFLAGMPINLPTHAHGQGYSDLNFLIPELVGKVAYRKGPYSAQQGDFAAAGSASIDYVRTLASSLTEIGFGQRGFRRLLAATSPQVGNGNLLVAVEGFRNDGPWDVPENLRKTNAVLRYSQGTEADGFDATLLAYDAKWNATDQVAQRAIGSNAAGSIGRFGTLDPTDGGTTSRYSLSGQWAARTDDTITRASAYAFSYRLNLFSNFTYFLDDPVNGDQFEQADRRTVFGGAASRTWLTSAGGRSANYTLGTKFRQDNIDTVALYLTRARTRLQPVRVDAVTQRAFALYGEAEVGWNGWLRTITGLRADTYSFDVAADTPANSGTRHASIVTPKLAAVIGPFDHVEFFAAIGHGFHSNDARGATIRVNPDPRDPGFGDPVDRVNPLVRAKGMELGARAVPASGLQTALALWRLDLGSELLFVGDAGTTQASRPSRRQGIELANYWTPRAGLIVDADFAWSYARFRGSEPGGDRIPGAIERTASLGVSIDDKGPWFGGLRLRYFGPRPLLEDDSVRSVGSSLVNARLGWRMGKQVEITLDALNLFDRKVNDIEYFYESQLRGERAPVADIHLHPSEPRTYRVSLRLNF